MCAVKWIIGGGNGDYWRKELVFEGENFADPGRSASLIWLPSYQGTAPYRGYPPTRWPQPSRSRAPTTCATASQIPSHSSARSGIASPAFADSDYLSGKSITATFSKYAPGAHLTCSG